MIKGLAITPPVVGRISIGKVVEKNGARLPVKDDQFTITTQIQGKDGWYLHPKDKELRESSANEKLRSIPITLLFNQPDLNLRAEYSMFDRKTGRPICVGNGQECQRASDNGLQTLPCPSPTLCEFGKGGLCKPFARLNVVIGDEDEMGTFIFRTTGFNSIRTLAARLSYLSAASGGLLACLPLSLRLRGKSTTQSFRSAIYYADITIREGLSFVEAITVAREQNEMKKAAGFDQQALDQIARECYANALFQEDEEEMGAVLEEFYPEVAQMPGYAENGAIPAQQAKLKDSVARQESKLAH